MRRALEHADVASGGGGMAHAKPRDSRGFTYIAVLIFIAIMGVGLAAVSEEWQVAMRREREAELLFAGDQLRNAIAMYYAHAPSPVGRYPMSLEDLLKDPRYPNTVRYLRKIYPDPITNSQNWKLIKGANGEILGVCSASEQEPLKKKNFSLADQAFDGKKKYSDWVFVVAPQFLPVMPAQTQPFTGPAPGVAR